MLTETEQYILSNGLTRAITWLRDNVNSFFPEVQTTIGVQYDEEEERNKPILIVHNSSEIDFDTFEDIKCDLFQALLENGFSDLYHVLIVVPLTKNRNMQEVNDEQAK